jgi:hypothetical protein
MGSFTVRGPFEIEYEKRKGGRVLLFDDFWDEDGNAADLAEERGCYVFALRNRALTPIYVGKAPRSFKQETFNPANKHKYNNGFSDYGRGTPVMYFVVHPTQRGRANAKEIREIENFLIQAGFAKNSRLQNVKGTQQPSWSIKGVVRSSGRPKRVETQFRSLFDIHDG